MKKNPHHLAFFACWTGMLIFVAVVQLPARGQAPAGGPPAAGGQQPPAPGGGRGITPGTESGFATFQTRCSICHGNPAVERAATPSAIREMTPERIYDALATGSMQAHSEGLNDLQKRALAEFMSGRPLGSAKQGDARNMTNKCTANPPLTDPARGAAWNGWGNGLSNTRFQSILEESGS